MSESVRALAETLQELTDKYVRKEMGLISFLDGLKKCGASPEESTSYVQQARDRMAREASGAAGPRAEAPGANTRGLDNSQGTASASPNNLGASPSQGLNIRQGSTSQPNPAPDSRNDSNCTTNSSQNGGRESSGSSQDNTARSQNTGGSNQGPADAGQAGGQGRSGISLGSGGSISNRDAVEAAAWAALASRLASASGAAPASRVQEATMALDFLKQAGQARESVTVGAPHLAQLSQKPKDPYLLETHRLRKVYSGDKVDEAIDIVQGDNFKTPLPRGIWKDIFLDKFIHFDKLFAAIEFGYDWADEAKDFGDGFSLVRKDHYHARKPVWLESEWTRIFEVWRRATITAYPHRDEELEEYREMVLDLFRAAEGHLSIAIKFDADVWERYSRSPFRLNSRDHTSTQLLAQMFSGLPGNPKKRVFPQDFQGTRRTDTICENWNLGKCLETPCRFRHIHGICSECSGTHRAKDHDTCINKLQARRSRFGGASGRLVTGGKD